MATAEQFADQLLRYVPDLAGDLDTTGRRLAAITAALTRLAVDMPNVIAEDVTTNPADVPGTWQPKTSKLVSVEWPVIAAGAAEPIFVAGALVMVKTDGTEEVRMPGAGVSGGAPARVRFTAAWTVTTLPAQLELAFLLCAAWLYATAMAGVYAAAVVPAPEGVPIETDGGRTVTYKDLAGIFESMYLGMFETKESGS